MPARGLAARARLLWMAMMCSSMFAPQSELYGLHCSGRRSSPCRVCPSRTGTSRGQKITALDWFPRVGFLFDLNWKLAGIGQKLDSLRSRALQRTSDLGLGVPGGPPGGTPSSHPRGFVVASALLRLLPSRVGFAERHASRPAYGGRSLVIRIRHSCVGGWFMGEPRSVRLSACVRSNSRPPPPALCFGSSDKPQAVAKPRAWRSHGLSGAKDAD